jgi:hypothetical protein
MFEEISEGSADDILTKVLAFRSQWQEFEKPDDVNALVQIFPHVNVRKGYVLDYVQEKTGDGVVLPIQPYARPEDDDSWIPMRHSSARIWLSSYTDIWNLSSALRDCSSTLFS